MEIMEIIGLIFDIYIIWILGIVVFYRYFYMYMYINNNYNYEIIIFPTYFSLPHSG
jgi:hypothetical protein